MMPGYAFIYIFIYLVVYTEYSSEHTSFARVDVNAEKYPGLRYHVGVMSSWKYSSSRMPSVYNTWGKEAANLTFYVGKQKKTHQSDNGLPVQVIQGVDDAVYPPRRKAFEMLQYWCDNLLDDFQWFIRADDDVYLKIFQLERFLFSLDHDKPYYIGRPGIGAPDERGSLGLRGNMYCCGPTVIFSRPTLKAMCPYVRQCLNDTVSNHEDTEVGRCVMKTVQIQCASNYQHPKLYSLFFHQNRNKETGFLMGDLTESKSFLTAISIHEVKENAIMYNLAHNDLVTRNAINMFKRFVKHKSNPLGVFQLKASAFSRMDGT